MTRPQSMPNAQKSALKPKLRFPEFRNAPEWTETTLGQLSEVLRGGSPRPIDGYLTTDPNGLNWLKIGDVEKGAKYVTGTEERVRVEALSKTREVHPGDLILSNSMSFGRPYILKIRSCIHDGWIAVTKINDQIDRDYLYYLITSAGSQTFFEDNAAGGGVRNLNADIIKTLPAFYPTKAEQQKVAACLSTLDELIGAESQKLDAFKAHKKGLMQQLFPREGETLPRLRFPEFQSSPEWQLKSVVDLVDAGYLFSPRDGNHGNIHPKSSDYVAAGIPFIMASDLDGGRIDTVSCHFISKALADTLQKGFAKEGDVLLSHKGTVGEVAVVRKIETPYLMLTPQVTYYRVKDATRLSNEFLAQLFLSVGFQAHLLKVSGGGTRAYIGITEQGTLLVQLPSDIAEQHRIATCLSSLDHLIAAQSDKLSALQSHKQGLMQQLFPSPTEAEA
jgi:type I restriction enzyme, S subunit